MKKTRFALLGCLALVLAMPVLGVSAPPPTGFVQTPSGGFVPINYHHTSSPHNSQHFLTALELHTLVSSHSLVKWPVQNPAYEMYFYPTGKQVSRFGKDNQTISWGKWWIDGNVIHWQSPAFNDGRLVSVHFVKLGQDQYQAVSLTGKTLFVFKRYQDVFPSLQPAVNMT